MVWYTAVLSTYAKSSPERPATSLYTWKSVADFMTPEVKRSCSIILVNLSVGAKKFENKKFENKKFAIEQKNNEGNLQTCETVWPDGYFATEAKLSIAPGWGPAY